MISWDHFAKVEMRVGTVLQARLFAEAKKPAYQLRIDFGKYGIKKSSAQITKLYKPEDLVGRQVICVTNFPPKQIASFRSEVLTLGVMMEEKDIVLLQPERPVPNGCRIA